MLNKQIIQESNKVLILSDRINLWGKNPYSMIMKIAIQD